MYRVRIKDPIFQDGTVYLLYQYIWIETPHGWTITVRIPSELGCAMRRATTGRICLVLHNSDISAKENLSYI